MYRYKPSSIRSNGMKPVNAPRPINVRTDSVGNPVAVQMPTTISSPRGRRAVNQRECSQRNHIPFKSSARSITTTSLLSDGQWLQVAAIENLWKVNDEWWRGAEKEISRLYYMLRLENSQQLTVYLDLITDNWCRQAG